MIGIGRFRIERVEEMRVRETTALYDGWTPAALDPLAPWFVGPGFDPADETFTICIQTWLVRDGTNTILIDTGSGNGKDRPLSPRFHHLNLPFLDRLAALGVAPGDVTHVILTHLHVDHVGWNTRDEAGLWVPTFPNAQYVMTQVERDWRDPARGAEQRPAGAALPFIDSVAPVLARSKVALVSGDEAGFLPGLDLIPIPGHAPGMMGVRLSDGGRQALFVADVMHTPVQVGRPDWSSKYCEDKALANGTRARILAHAADTGALVIPAHFAFTHCGHVRRDGAGYAWAFSDEAP